MYKSHTTVATSGAGTVDPSGAHEFTPGFSGVLATRSLVLYVCFVDRCLSFCPPNTHTYEPNYKKKRV
jgi:hypothetical protein